MSKRRDRSLPQSNSSSNTNGAAPLTPQSPTFLSLPRSASPSITGFLTKPSKWFSRPSTNYKNANPPLPPVPNDPPRSSSSGSRRPTISGPSDPRPILQSPSVETCLGASRSVLDLSLSGTQKRVSAEAQNLDIHANGDLDSISRKGWSRSVDDLGRFSTLPNSSNGSSSLTLSTSPPREDDSSSPTKARIEAYRKNSPHSPHSFHPHYPFPTIQTTSPSSPTAVPHIQSITEVATSSVHNRSDSLASIQPLKLVPLKTRSVPLHPGPHLQPPPSQLRNRSVSSFERERERDKDRSNRAAFAFPFSSTGNSNKPQNTNTVPTQTAPQSQAQQRTLPSSSSSPLEESKRTSQIVHYAGFINRHPGAHPGAFRSTQALAAALSKGWKPYRGILKGSKLYFYKPPSDRALEIKELFPQGMEPAVDEVPPTVETAEEEPDISTKPRDDMRKRIRVYRGRATHPELVISQDGCILRGSTDAFIHEALFGSTLQGDFTDTDNAWSRFATATIMCIPRLVGQTKFEAEFIRYGTYLISGADEEDQPYLRTRTIWLAERYCTFHGHPRDPQSWETFNVEALDHVFSPSSSADQQDGLLDGYAFSPQPSQSYTRSPFALSASTVVSLNHVVSRPSMTQKRFEDSIDRAIWLKLETDGLTSELVLALDSAMLARSLTIFHRTSLSQYPSPLATDFVRTGPYNVEERSVGTSDSVPYTEFFGSSNNPHWLTRYVVTQILSSGAVVASPSQDSNLQVSKTHLRSDLIAQWIKVGEHCRQAGDRCSWKAIEAALCSRAIARLDKPWRRTDTSALRILQSWLKGEEEDATKPVLTPWGADVLDRIADTWQKARTDSSGKDDQWDAASIQNISDHVQFIIQAISRSRREFGVDEQSDFVAQVFRCWQTIQAQPPPRLSSLNVYLSQSFAAEPRQKCLFEPYYWQLRSNPSSIHALVPLLFTEPLPTVTLIDRDLIYRGKKESLEHVTVHPGLDEAQISRITRMKPLSRISKRSRDSSQLLPTGETAGLVLRLYDGELLLLVPDNSLDSSRPPSMLESGLERRTSQMRVATTGLDRKSSMARRSSLPSLSQSNTFSIPESSPAESTLRVVIKAGTLDRLVDVLVSGLDGVTVAGADDNGETPLREGRPRTLKLDRDEFRSTWWLVFRSFVTPLVLFELLRKRFIKANAGSNPKVSVCLDVISTIHHWIDNGDGARDALGNSTLFDAMKTLLGTAFKFQKNANDDVFNLCSELENARQNTLVLFTMQTYRPKFQVSIVRDSVLDSSPRNFGPNPPTIDEVDAETLVDNLDALAATAMRSVTQEDLFVTIDLFEVQSTDRTGWYLSYDPVTNTDETEIQTMYSHLQQIEPTPLISELSNEESVYKLLPPSIRSLIRTHAVIRKFLMSKIVTPHLGLKIRQARMEILLRAIEICRLRMVEHYTCLDATSQKTVRSFVETAIISAIVSPESRLFTAAWTGVANARGSSVESLAALLSKPVVRSVTYNTKLTIDAGWLLERLLEMISLPNTMDSEVEGLSVINFDKRRHLSRFVTTALTLVPYRSPKLHVHLDRTDIERLNNMHRELMGSLFDNRVLKDDAYYESLNAGSSTPHSRKNQRPFIKIVQSQQDKCKRDRTLRDRLLREKKAEQQRTEKREEDLHRAMNYIQPNPQSVKHQRSRRTMSSAFFHLMRPLSSAFSSTDNLYIQKRTAKALEFEPTSKPSLVISLAGATVTPYINNIRLYTFHLTTEDGGQYLLQSSTRSTLDSWMTAISQTAKAYTAKRLTYIASTPKPQLSDHIQIPSQTARRHPTAVFGVELDFLLQREAGDNEIAVGAVPRILERCLSEIEAHGLHEVGLYRIPGASSAISAMRREFDSGGVIFSQDYVDIFAVCDVVKTWLRALPHAIFPEKSYQEVIQIMQIPDFDERLIAVRNVVRGLPVNYFYLLRRMCEHLDRITDYEEQNHMTAQALAVLFNPTLLRSPTNDFGVLMHNMNHTSLLLQTLIIHFHRIFDEGDVEQDDEGETDIMNNSAVELKRIESRSSSVPTDAIHDHDPDLEPFSSLPNEDAETS